MLKVLFPKSSGDYEYSRFGAELEFFARWLLAAGYLPAAAGRHVHRLKCILEATGALQCGQSVEEAELDEAIALVSGALRHASTERAYRRFLKAEGRLEETKPQRPVEQLLLRYREYLLDVRGLYQRERSLTLFEVSKSVEF
ncbi:hypothetical protein WGT02_30680 (plasmid) [Rhizobium sp. T1470]|uniref:hypothetical protein n=1 Tax=unclassified Rhizobium TaxID=2613769 RepID=UPI001AAFCA37|nr:hypothetical protein [Rhizobium sp. T1473]MCA0806037.1 hypothetical protein [Rhizobium sp. T1473]